jgi:hypothetical protein
MMKHIFLILIVIWAIISPFIAMHYVDARLGSTTSCTISYNSALADIPHMQKQIKELKEQIEKLDLDKRETR